MATTWCRTSRLDLCRPAGDVLRFEATGFHSLNELLADAHQVGGDVLIQIDDHSSVTLLNTKLAALTEANVLFA